MTESGRGKSSDLGAIDPEVIMEHAGLSEAEAEAEVAADELLHDLVGASRKPLAVISASWGSPA